MRIQVLVLALTLILLGTALAAAACVGPTTPALPPDQPVVSGAPTGIEPTTIPGRQPPTGDPPPTSVATPDMAINSFEDCVNAGYPVMESYPRQCRVPGGKLFVEDVTVEGIATAQVATVEPEDPAGVGLSAYPDRPLAALPVAPISVRELIEHRSALNDRIVRVRGVVVATLLGDQACPSDRGACAQPSLFLADTTQAGRDPHYDLRVLVSEAEIEEDYPIGATVELRVRVYGDRAAVVGQKID